MDGDECSDDSWQEGESIRRIPEESLTLQLLTSQHKSVVFLVRDITQQKTLDAGALLTLLDLSGLAPVT